MGNEIGTRIFDFARKILVEPFEDYGEVAVNDEVMIKALQEAKESWQTARSYFDHATDPDLIDHAIYSIEAAERKYMYLLKQAKTKGFILTEPISPYE